MAQRKLNLEKPGINDLMFSLTDSFIWNLKGCYRSNWKFFLELLLQFSWIFLIKLYFKLLLKHKINHLKLIIKLFILLQVKTTVFFGWIKSYNFNYFTQTICVWLMYLQNQLYQQITCNKLIKLLRYKVNTHTSYIKCLNICSIKRT